MNTITGNISPRTTAYMVKDLLTRAMPTLIFERFGQAHPIPEKSTKTIKFRRYFLANNGIANDGAYLPGTYFGGPLMQANANARAADYGSAQDGTILAEGVTPKAVDLAKADYNATLVQFGSYTTFSDQIMDFHEDPILKEATDILGEEAAVILENARKGTLLAGTNVLYANGSATSGVNTVMDKKLLAKAERLLKRQLAKPISKEVKSTPAYGTKSVRRSYVGVCHPDLEYDIRAMAGFVPAEDYGTGTAMEGEIGSVGGIRFIQHDLLGPLATAGATGGTNVLEDGDSKAIVYPVLIFGADAYGLVPFKGKNAVTPTVVGMAPSDSDPLGQRSHVGWKAYSATIILNDPWMMRLEVACTAL